MDNDGNGIGSVVANNFAFAGCVGSGNEHTEGGDTDTAASRWPFVDLNICFPRLVNATATVDAEGAPPSAPLPLLAMPPPSISTSFVEWKTISIAIGPVVVTIYATIGIAGGGGVLRIEQPIIHNGPTYSGVLSTIVLRLGKLLDSKSKFSILPKIILQKEFYRYEVRVALRERILHIHHR